MSRMVLGVTGSVAAIRTPELFGRLTADGHDVRVIATEPALRFFDARALPADRLFRDADEWPEDRLYQRGDPVPHIQFRDWADLLAIAPLDANTLGKLALGLCDNFLTCLARAWDYDRKPVVLAPAMNTRMWRHPATLRHLRQVLEDGTGGEAGTDWTIDEAEEAFARRSSRLVLIAPRSKRLACGEVGMGAMAEVATIAEQVRRTLAEVDPE